MVAGPVERCMARIGGPFTLLVCDPPYADLARAARVLEEIARGGTLAAGAVVVVEHASRDEPPEIAHLTRGDARTYGDTAISIYELSQAAGSV